MSRPVGLASSGRVLAILARPHHRMQKAPWGGMALLLPRAYAVIEIEPRRCSLFLMKCGFSFQQRNQPRRRRRSLNSVRWEKVSLATFKEFGGMSPYTGVG